MRLPWFAEPVSGWVIRFGASKRPEPFTHSLLLTDDGEFVAVNTKNPLNITVVRTALEAGRLLLNGREPFWRHRQTQEKAMKAKVTTEFFNDDGSFSHRMTYEGDNISPAGCHDIYKRVDAALTAIGDAELAASVKR